MQSWNVKRAWVVGLLLLAGLAIATPAFSYILPAKFYLKKVSAHRYKFRRLRIKQMTTLFRNGKSVTYDETVWFSAPGKVRRDRFLKGNRIQVDVWNDTSWKQWRKSTGQTKSGDRLPQPRFDLFSVEPSGTGFGGLFGMMSKLGVRYRGTRRWSKFNGYRIQTSVGLRLFQGNISVVLGAVSPKSKANQVWLDAKRNVPLRFIGRLKENGPVVDVKFLDYVIQTGLAVFPGRIERTFNGKLQLRSLVSEVKKLRSIPSSKFQQIP